MNAATCEAMHELEAIVKVHKGKRFSRGKTTRCAISLWAHRVSLSGIGATNSVRSIFFLHYNFSTLRSAAAVADAKIDVTPQS